MSTIANSMFGHPLESLSFPSPQNYYTANRWLCIVPLPTKIVWGPAPTPSPPFFCLWDIIYAKYIYMYIYTCMFDPFTFFLSVLWICCLCLTCYDQLTGRWFQGSLQPLLQQLPKVRTQMYVLKNITQVHIQVFCRKEKGY